MNEHVKILTDSSIIINRIVQLLEKEKIYSIVRDNIESARLAGFGVPPNDVELYVDKADIESAERIIKSFMKGYNQ